MMKAHPKISVMIQSLKSGEIKKISHSIAILPYIVPSTLLLKNPNHFHILNYQMVSIGDTDNNKQSLLLLWFNYNDFLKYQSKLNIQLLQLINLQKICISILYLIKQNHNQLQLKLNKPNGIGSCHFNNGGFYYGEWKNNTIHGFGVYFFNVGGYIRGEFKEGLADGKCELQYQNGQLYQGHFKLGKQQGVGIKIGRRGKEVVQYKDSLRVCLYEEPQQLEDIQMMLKDHLPQIYIHNDRVVYGLQIDLTGLGVIQYNNGRVDLGWFQNGSLNGKGKIIFKSGDIYDGELKNGFFQGQGFYLNYNSKQLTEGQFERNQILSIEKQDYMYPPYSNEDIQIVDQRILIKNIHLKTRVMIGNKQQNSSEKQSHKVNQISNGIQHLIQSIKKTQKSESSQHEEVLDNLLARVQSPQQRKNLQQIISQVTSPQRIR